MLLHCFYLFFTLISQIKSASIKLPSYKALADDESGAPEPLVDRNVRLRLRRQAPGEEQTYQLEINFPTKDSNRLDSKESQKDRIERLIQSIILEQVRNLVFWAFLPFWLICSHFLSAMSLRRTSKDLNFLSFLPPSFLLH